jgi:hypothetical protein
MAAGLSPSQLARRTKTLQSSSRASKQYASLRALVTRGLATMRAWLFPDGEPVQPAALCVRAHEIAARIRPTSEKAGSKALVRSTCLLDRTYAAARTGSERISRALWVVRRRQLSGRYLRTL